MRWEIPNQLARSSRPGYQDEKPTQVAAAVVDAWLSDARDLGVKGIICLLADDQLRLYDALPEGLLAHYQENGFAVAPIPVQDHKSPAMSTEELAEVWRAYNSLPKPVLIHCSAGVDRTGAAIRHIRQRLTTPE